MYEITSGAKIIVAVNISCILLGLFLSHKIFFSFGEVNACMNVEARASTKLLKELYADHVTLLITSKGLLAPVSVSGEWGSNIT